MKEKHLTNVASLAAGVLVGGMMFSDNANAANIIDDSSFEGDNSAAGPWGAYTRYAQNYGGVDGPDLNLVTTVDYGFFDNITLNAGAGFMGVEQVASNELTQTLSLVSGDLTAGQILAGQGRFALSAWMQTCCGDEPAIEIAFNDALGTTFFFDRTAALFRQTTADREVNPGGANNATSDTNIRYWAFYEVKDVIPTDATMVTVKIKDAPGHTHTGGGDFGTDLLILDTVAVVPEPSTTALLGLAGLGFILRRRK